MTRNVHCYVSFELYLGTRRNRCIQLEAPPVTKHIARTLERYPDGGQILKVSYNIYLGSNCIVYIRVYIFSINSYAHENAERYC